MLNFKPAHPGEIVLAWIEKHPFKQVGGGFQRGGIAGAHFAVNFDQGFLRRLDAVFPHGLAQNHTHVIPLGIENRKFS